MHQHECHSISLEDRLYLMIKDVQPDVSQWEISCYFEIVEWTMGRPFSYFKSCSLEILLPCQLWSTIEHNEHNWAHLNTMPFFSRRG